MGQVSLKGMRKSFGAVDVGGGMNAAQAMLGSLGGGGGAAGGVVQPSP